MPGFEEKLGLPEGTDAPRHRPRKPGSRDPPTPPPERESEVSQSPNLDAFRSILNRHGSGFPQGTDCIFRLRGMPYSLWTFLSLGSESDLRVRLGCGLPNPSGLLPSARIALSNGISRCASLVPEGSKGVPEQFGILPMHRVGPVVLHPDQPPVKGASAGATDHWA